ncbi:helix-turn-helix domain-containing protein [Saccharibacillus alkalitolerans]|uniref:Helix-turn-helix domain-containing protein n=1 Tax=Saccharibacillus alkalitolerans TaxID=2705290 RepID=A0ABX0F262_9BACL|nr:helix-turn-helix domain-containing protein [Saccharibacillus alkalitolerans]NGZ74124.1 helix-turn-helix domain-containing protein [Saccharibacillus alkalitolerans]
MNILHDFRSRKYLQRILLSFMLVVAVLAAVSLLLNSSARSRVIGMQEDADRKLLTQINYNIENMNGIVTNQAVSMYNDEELIALKSGGDYRQSILKIGRLNRTVAASPYLHAAVFYNGAQRRFFSSINHDLASNEMLYGALQNYMKSSSVVPKLQLVPLDLDGSGTGIDVFAMFIYDGPSVGSVNDNLLILTVKPGWMLDNMKALNLVSERKNDLLFLADGSGRILLSTAGDLPEGLDARSELLPKIASSNPTLGSFPYDSGGQRYKVTYLNRATNNWQIVSLQNADEVLGSVRQMKWTEAVVLLSAVTFAVLLSVLFALRLYKPVGQLLSLVPESGRPAARAGDELTLIAANVTEMAGRLKGLEQERASQSNIAKSYHLRSLIGASESLDEAAFARLREQYGLDVSVGAPMRLALAQIDDLQGLAGRPGSRMESLLAFAVANVGQELLREFGSCEAAELKSGHLLFIVGAEPRELDRLGERFRELQETIRQYYRTSFTVTLTEPFSDYRAITPMYQQAVRHSGYRMILGRGSVIEPEQIRNNEEREALEIPQELERRLSEGLKSGRLEDAEQAVRSWRTTLSGFSAENTFSAVLHLTVTLSGTLGELNRNNLHPLPVNLQTVNRRILEKETLDEIEEALLEIVREVCGRGRSGREDKSRLLAETVKEIIDKHYADPDLNVQRIADMLKVSTIYLGQTFKTEEGQTVVDRINATRLARAKDYLEQQSLTVTEIMQKVGFGNESYFYRLFKKRYGATPKEYRLKSAIERST